MSQIQLVARGDIDASLTGNPSITFFKSVYRKHTNFSMEDMVVDTISKPLTGHKYPLKIPTGTGDLLYGTNYIIRGNKTYCGNGIANISTAVIDNIAFVINSRQIDKTYGHYLEVYHELNQENPNSTITNLGRIEDSSLYHIAHNADLAVLAAQKNASYKTFNYIDNAICKPSNIMGAGMGYPPTHFQKLSKCGGTYCSPTYLQEQNILQPTNTVPNASDTSNFNYVISMNNRPISSSYVQDINSDLVYSASFSAPYLNGSQINDSIKKGDILGDCTVPLNFWYCKSPGMAIPLCALHKSVDVELYMQFSSISDAHWTEEIEISELHDPYNMNLSYDQNINNLNDVVNAYQIGDNLKGILNNGNKSFNFDVDIEVTYIYLDNMERKRFSQSSHEYLIEQLQFHYENGQKNKDVDISSFQHPVKELIWTGQPYLKTSINNFVDDTTDRKNISDKLNTGEYAHKSGIRWVHGNSTDNCIYGGGIQNASQSRGFGNASFEPMFNNNNCELKVNNYADGTINAWSSIGEGKFVQGLLGPSTPDCLDYVTYKLKFNSTDRCQPRPLQYFTRENVYKYHKGGSISVPDSIAVYSFALNPTDISPSGTCNFSNIDDIKIERGDSKSSDSNIRYKKLNVYAINYNILRIVNGQAGISYF